MNYLNKHSGSLLLALLLQKIRIPADFITAVFTGAGTIYTCHPVVHPRGRLRSIMPIRSCCSD